MLIEQNYRVRWLYLLEYQFAFGCFLLFFCKALGVLEFRDDDEFERHIVTDALHIITDARLEMLVGGLTHEYQQRLHLFSEITYLTDYWLQRYEEMSEWQNLFK